MVTVFTCGPSVYQRAHIGNFRTFLFEDILVRYLMYAGYRVQRGMSLTDVEDKAIAEAERKKMTLLQLTSRNIEDFLREMNFLRMKEPDFLPRASEHVEDAARLTRALVQKGYAYWHGGNAYFDPLTFPDFGRLFGLDMSRWPRKKRRFHRDTYPGVQWNRGDFILWHGYKPGDPCFWDTEIGRGRPAWNIQDASMISHFFDETLSIYCGGIDNLYRHHDYTKAILESVRGAPMAKYWLHCNHLFVRGEKMSKSEGNVIYTDTLCAKGYDNRDVRFFLIDGHYREKMDYDDALMDLAVQRLRNCRRLVGRIRRRAGKRYTREHGMADAIRHAFARHMDNDLRVRDGFDGVVNVISSVNAASLHPHEARSIINALREIDEVLQVIF